MKWNDAIMNFIGGVDISYAGSITADVEASAEIGAPRTN